MTVTEMYSIARREARKVPAEDRDDVVQDALIRMLPTGMPALASLKARDVVRRYWQKRLRRERIVRMVSMETPTDSGTVGGMVEDEWPDPDPLINPEAVLLFRERLKLVVV